LFIDQLKDSLLASYGYRFYGRVDFSRLPDRRDEDEAAKLERDWSEGCALMHVGYCFIFVAFPNPPVLFPKKRLGMKSDERSLCVFVASV